MAYYEAQELGTGRPLKPEDNKAFKQGAITGSIGFPILYYSLPTTTKPETTLGAVVSFPFLMLFGAWMGMLMISPIFRYFINKK